MLNTLKNNLETRGFRVSLFASREEASAYLNREIDGTSVGFGGSVTLREMELFASLSSHNEVFSHGERSLLEKYTADEIRTRAMTTEVYISSLNAVSLDGRLVNIDGAGNRIASTAYGHSRVYFVVGKNKIAKTLEDAVWRAKNIAAPKNAQRLGMKTPCAVNAEKCYDCNSPERICCGTLIMDAPMKRQITEIVLVDEELGY